MDYLELPVHASNLLLGEWDSRNNFCWHFFSKEIASPFSAVISQGRSQSRRAVSLIPPGGRMAKD